MGHDIATGHCPVDGLGVADIGRAVLDPPGKRGPTTGQPNNVVAPASETVNDFSSEYPAGSGDENPQTIRPSHGPFHCPGG
jgi:hypothetical protein